MNLVNNRGFNDNHWKSERNPLLNISDDATFDDAALGALDRFGIVALTDTQGRIVYANEEFVRLSKYTRAELIGSDHRILNSGLHTKEFFGQLYRTIANGGIWRGEIRNRAKDGTLYWVDAHIEPWRSRSGKLLGYIALRVDITARKELENALWRHAELLQSVVDQFPGGVAVFDGADRLALHNEKLLSLLGYPRELFSAGPPSLEQLLRFNAERGEYGQGTADDQVKARLALVRQRKPHTYERTRPDGTTLEVRGAPLEGGGFVTTYIDVSDRKRNEAIVAHMAHHDTLTGLPNRLLLLDRLSVAVTRAKRGELVAVHYLDLDRFKSVNDSLGHPIGDALLKAVASRLRNCIRATDTVARIGGDEFIIVQVALKSAADARLLAERVLKELSCPFQIGDNQIQSGTSVGIAVAPFDGGDAEELLRNADLALYRSKCDGRGGLRFFEREMDAKLRAQRRLELDLAGAIDRDELSLCYQPIVDLKTGAVVCCEALLRWNHGQIGPVPTTDFIAIAEATGMIRPIGEWAIKQACRDAQSWQTPVKVAVNVSSCQFTSTDLEAVVAEALTQSALSPDRLVLEITETAYFQRSLMTIETLTRLRHRGVQIALDDFGSGYSSLNYLQTLPIDKIKIDRSFLSELTVQERAIPILRAIIGLGRDLGVSTIAEGVESEQQLEYLIREGCTHAQGYFFCHPVTNAALTCEIGKTHGSIITRYADTGSRVSRHERRRRNGKERLPLLRFGD